MHSFTLLPYMLKANKLEHQANSPEDVEFETMERHTNEEAFYSG